MAANQRLTKLDRSVADRVVIVTGAASGMGRATAYLFADEGAKVIAIDQAEGVLQTADDITEAGGIAKAWVADITDASRMAAVVAEGRETFGPIDILVNNAGISVGLPLEAPEFDQAWDRTIAVNLTAYVQLIRLCLADLKRNADGRIINIASTEGVGGSAYISPYTASKHGVVGLTKSLAVELGQVGVTVNCICPGPIHTGMTAGIEDEAKTKFARRRVPLRRYGDPEEVAHGTLSFALPAASYITGAVLPVDGGMLIKNN